MLDINSLVTHTTEWGFCHIPKNAGLNFRRRYKKQHTMSPDKILVDIGKMSSREADTLFRHQPASWFEEQGIRPQQWICISRNPYSRYVSWFFYIKQLSSNWNSYSFEDFVTKNLLEETKERSSRTEFIAQGGLWWVSDTQSIWLKDKPSMKVFKLEDGLKDMEDYTNTRFMDTVINSTMHDPWETYYTGELKHLVYERYSEDFRNFGYER